MRHAPTPGATPGDLDRVIQIDAPATAATFLQRLGRTGRRPGTSRNCLFLTLDGDALTEAAALLLLWSRGWVEPVTPRWALSARAPGRSSATWSSAAISTRTAAWR